MSAWLFSKRAKAADPLHVVTSTLQKITQASCSRPYKPQEHNHVQQKNTHIITISLILPQVGQDIITFEKYKKVLS